MAQGYFIAEEVFFFISCVCALADLQLLIAAFCANIPTFKLCKHIFDQFNSLFHVYEIT